MEEVQSKSTNPTYNVDDSNLPAITASLEMLTVNTNLSPSGNKIILRKRVPKQGSHENLNRRCSLIPKKRTYSKIRSEDDIKEYYLDKSFKTGPKSLETIYEEMDNISENARFMSVRRYKRMIQFRQYPSDSKIKKRKAKAKKMALGSSVNSKKRQATMQMLLDTLNRNKAISLAKLDNQVK